MFTRAPAIYHAMLSVTLNSPTSQFSLPCQLLQPQEHISHCLQQTQSHSVSREQGIGGLSVAVAFKPLDGDSQQEMHFPSPAVHRHA